MWQAFTELSTCRSFGMGVVGPIPATAIWAYVDRYGLPEWVVDAIFVIDAAWMTSERQIAEAKAEEARRARDPANDPEREPDAPRVRPKRVPAPEHPAQLAKVGG